MTPEGFHVGSTLAELRSIYPDLTPKASEICGLPFSVLLEQSVDINGGFAGLFAWFGEVPVPEGDPTDASVPLPPGYEDTPVTALEGGLYVGC